MLTPGGQYSQELKLQLRRAIACSSYPAAAERGREQWNRGFVTNLVLFVLGAFMCLPLCGGEEPGVEPEAAKIAFCYTPFAPVLSY
jgi:hypothetical protein